MEPRSFRKSSASAAPASALQIDIARRVLEMIRSGLVKAGDHLTEESLAKTYGVSRTPVRHALRLLQEQGLVEVRANAGTFVAESAADAAEASAQGATTVLAPPDEGEDNLYKRILADRASHQLPQSLSESALAARYGAPRGTLRRTLLRLTSEGLIERRRGHGWTFTPALDTPAAMAESYRFRMILECAGLREPHFEVDLDELRRARDEQLAFIDRNGSQDRDAMPGEFYRMNASFHEMLARFSRNRFIEQAVRQQNQLRRLEEFASFVARPVNPVDSCREHIDIIDALLTGDVDWAASLLYRHLSVASRR
jgi:DNA-binding GntR family transcriptional regulator